MPARGKIDFSYFISCWATVERTGLAVRGGGFFIGGYRANGLAGHGGPSLSMEEKRRLPPPFLLISSHPRCLSIKP
jgi:hypothetical protein